MPRNCRHLCLSFASLRLVALSAALASLSPIPAAMGWPDEPAPATSIAPHKAVPLDVVVTLAPLRGLVEPLLPEGSKIAVLMPPGRSEHGYEFTANDIAQLGRADLVVLVGLGLEPQVESFLRKQPSSNRRVVDLGEALKLREAEKMIGDKKVEPAQKPEAAPHAKPDPGAKDRAPETQHDDSEHPGFIDPHVWLDPQLVLDAIPEIKQAVLDALESKGTVSDSTLRDLDKAALGVIERVKSVHNDYTKRLKPYANAPIITHHAAFARLARRYGLRVVEVIRPIESSEPAPSQIADVVSAIRKQGVKVIFVEPQFNATAAERIAATAGVRVGRLDPLGDGDWFRMMQANLDELVSKLGKPEALDGGK